jgi:hypothetical protein
MKLRIKGNSLRLRLGPAEVEQLLATGWVEETIRFAAGESAKLTYALELTDASDGVSLRYLSGEVTVLLAREQALRWARGGEVTIAGAVVVGQELLELLVEKDFACLDRMGREKEDTFPNPKADTVC